MIKTSPIYQQLFKEGAIQEYRVNIDGVAYGHEILKDSVSLQQNLLDKSTFTVGSFTISVLKLKLKLPSENIPHNANVVFSYRYNNGDVQSEWIEKFKGKITKRTKYTEEVTSIEAKDKASNYDKFLDFFGDVIDKYPANTRVVANLCAKHLGLEIENIEDVVDLDIVDYPNESTMVEMLKNVARNSGGNWVISGDRLRLVTTGNKYYTWVKFADDDQGNGMSENEDGKEYYGIYYGLNDSGNKDDYTWYEMPSDRNLIKWTDSFDGFSFYSDTAGNRGKFLIKDNVLTLLPEENGNSYWTFEFEDNINLEQNETYTLSFDIKSDDNTTIGVYWYPSEKYRQWRIKPEETWTRVSFTYTQSGATIKKPVKGTRHLMGLHHLTKNKKYSIKKIKLEKGSQATPWTPAISETKVDFPAQSIETSSLLSPISKILMYYADESAFESGNDTGSTLEIDSPWGTQSSADYVHGVLNGYEYVPVKSLGTYIDPAVELGDIVSIDGYDVLVANVKWVFDGIVTAEIEVPINNEINYDDPYNQLVQNQFKRKISLGDSYQGVTISRDKGIEMLVSPDRTEENATGRYYADLYRGIAFQTRDNKNQDWHDWMYFDLNENMFKLSLYETKEITDGKFINLTNKYNNLVMTVDGLSSEIAQIQGGNIISNFVGELGVFDWSFEAEPLYPRNDLYPNNKLHPRDRNGAIMRVVETDTAAGTGFELFAIGKAISQYAIVEGGADYSLYTRTKGANGVRFILREYSSADGSGSYQETVLATAVSSSNWTTLNHTLTIKQHTQSVRMVVEKTNYQETVFTNSSFNFGNPRPYTQSIADVNAKADYAKTLSEQTALEFTQTAQLVEQLDERVISSESKIIQNANEISTKVNKNSVISEINQSAETISIKANKVELEGYTSINKHFKVLPNGDVEFTNATGNNMTITGNLTAGRIAGLNFNNSKITFPNGKLTLNSNTNSIDFGSGLQMEHSTFRTDLAVYDVAYFKSPTANTGVQIGVERGAGGRSIPFVMAQAIYGVSSQYPLILNGVYGDIAYKGRILYIDSNGYVRAR